MTSPEEQKIINAALAARGINAGLEPVVPTSNYEPSPRPEENHSVTVVSATSGVLPVVNLKSLDNWRAFIHQVVMVLVPVLVTLNFATESQVYAWVPFIFAIADNVLSVGNTTDKIRKVIYAVVGLLQTGGLVTVLFSDTHPEYIPIASAVLTIGSTFLARFYTPTTTMVPAIRTGPEMKDVI